MNDAGPYQPYVDYYLPTWRLLKAQHELRQALLAAIVPPVQRLADGLQKVLQFRWTQRRPDR